MPPKQFYPKEIRKRSLNLWRVPTHRQCNESYREDEEYFYHAVYIMVQEGNRQMGRAIHQDLVRRTHKSQTPAMVRRLMKDFRGVSDGGICMPPGVVQFNLDAYRVERVAIKIAQGLFCLEQERCVARQNCKDIRLCENEGEVPELYRLSWGMAEAKSVLPAVFSYRCFEFEDLYLFSMLFWETVMFCAAFEDPSTVSAPAA